jgi:uncharacterized protein (DUF433 family)
VVVDPRVCHGKPTIRGTRVPITVLLGALAGGDDTARIADDYGVTVADILAAVAYANLALDAEQHFSLRAKAS